MTKREAAEGRALANLQAAFRGGRRLPAMVFHGSWAAYRFFEPEIVFDPRFVAIARILLEREPARCIGVGNLTLWDQGRSPVVETLYLDERTTPEGYMSSIVGRGLDWGPAMNDFGLASDVGGWSIYCERTADTGVFAARDRASIERLQPALDGLGALPIREAFGDPPTVLGVNLARAPLSCRIRPAWWRELLRSYDGGAAPDGR